MTQHARRHSGVRFLAAAVGAAAGVGAMAFAAPPEADPTSEVVIGNINDDGTVSIDFGQIQAMMGGRNAGNASESKFKPWSEVSKGFEKVSSAAEGGDLYGLYVNRKTNQMLAELPRGYQRQKHYFAMTVKGGVIFAGLQSGERYVQWKRIGDRLALIQPQLEYRSTGDQESKDSTKTVFMDRVLVDVPILTDGPNGQPVIDLDALLLGNARSFFGGQANGLNQRLAEIETAKSFPRNMEIAYTAPTGGGSLKTFHYSISTVQGTPGYKPRLADERVGYFVTWYRDLGKTSRQETATRYINRWHVEKADRSLKLSPPKEPIIFYVEHTAPVRYRRFIRQGIEYWNKAFAKIGIDGAIEVRYQDKATGAHMEKDPEDVRYNFIRWISNDVSTAIGPSRVNPETGEILDADVVLTDGWMRVFDYRWNDMLPELATEGMSPQTLAWFEENPSWDPRIRLAAPEQRQQILAERASRGILRYGGHPAAAAETRLFGDDEYDGLVGRTTQMAGMCLAARGKALNLATMMMHLDLIEQIDVAMKAAESQSGDQPEIDDEMLEVIRKQLEQNPGLRDMLPEYVRARLDAERSDAEPEDEPKEDGDGDKPKGPKKEASDKIDGVPEWFIGPALAELVAHEVGHTLGLRHNFKGSSIYTLDEINSDEVKGKKPWSATVMDYNGINIRMPGSGEIQGDYSVIDIGPYDYWAIEYGYTFGDPKEVLKRTGEPGLAYGTDEDTWGPDPLSRRYDLSADPIDYAKNQMKLAKWHRENLLESFVEDGDSWSEVRRGYGITLSTQMSSLSMMANWVGSAFTSRAKKGDEGVDAPIEVVDADVQREALKFCIENSFYPESFGLTPELLKHMTVDKWWDNQSSIMADPTFPVHDRILGIQSSVMSMLVNPTTLQRVFDHEYFVPSDQDALTLPEVVDTVTTAAWSEIDATPTKKYTARDPMISSLRRNLQREYLSRMIDLSLQDTTFNAAGQAVKTLATQTLRDLQGKIEAALSNGAKNRIDPYTLAHLNECHIRIDKALDADYIYNTGDIAPRLNLSFPFGRQSEDRDD